MDRIVEVTTHEVVWALQIIPVNSVSGVRLRSVASLGSLGWIGVILDPELNNWRRINRLPVCEYRQCLELSLSRDAWEMKPQTHLSPSLRQHEPVQDPAGYAAHILR